jgi:hypothetical protein
MGICEPTAVNMVMLQEQGIVTALAAGTLNLFRV